MKDIFDVIVIGGGPAGILSAGVSASRGAKVLLLEKNSELGKKLLLTGNGRCNITHAESDIRKLISSYGENGAFLFSAFHAFGPKQTMDFFDDLGVPLKIEENERVFPVSDSAKTVLSTLKKYLEKNKVQILYNAEVKSIEGKDDQIHSIVLTDGKVFQTKNCIIAVGGLSYSLTGATGDGYIWAKKLGIETISPSPALVPLKIQEGWIKELQGVALENVEVTVWKKKKKKCTGIGDMLFTHFGVSGPVILNISKCALEAKKSEDSFLTIDMVRKYSSLELDKKFQEDFKEKNKLFVKNYLLQYIPKRMVEQVLIQLQIDGEKRLSDITREERKSIVKNMKELSLTVSGHMGFDVAIITSGGVSIKELDPKTMASKKIPNLYFVGEVVDIDGPTGGYNLQVAWSTGFVAGSSVKF
ncbi:MAG: NAD(P)/FAD-dependent oxidoreductase [Candidatus Magasanikbacteria bacterium]